MKRMLLIGLLLAWGSAGYAIPGDLNLDGVVDFSDFFIFSDNFGMEGPPDTLRVEVVDSLVVEVADTVHFEVWDTVIVKMAVWDTTRVTILDTTITEMEKTIFDTLEVEKHVDVFDTTTVTLLDTTIVKLEETVYDTVVVLHPAVGDYTAEEQDNYISSTDDPLEGMRVSSIRHRSDRFRLGPGLAMQEHEYIRVIYFEDGRRITREYLKPSGHILKEDFSTYEVEVLYTGTGYIELKYAQTSYWTTKTYYYNADMEVVDIETDVPSYTLSDRYYEWWYLTLASNEIWTCEVGDTELERPDFQYEYTYAPVNFESELSQ